MSDEQLARTVDYYLDRTSHGSTLSSVVTAWVLARYRPEEAWRFLQRALDSDVADVQGGTTAEGIHLGAMAGTVDFVLRCLTGMRARGPVLRFDPAMPPEIKQLRFSVHYRGHRVERCVLPRTGSRSVPARARQHPLLSWCATTLWTCTQASGIPSRLTTSRDANARQGTGRARCRSGRAGPDDRSMPRFRRHAGPNCR